jgi:hypothetical protein
MWKTLTYRLSSLRRWKQRISHCRNISKTQQKDKGYHTVGTFPKSNWYIVETGKNKYPLETLIHDHSLSWLSTTTSIKSGGVFWKCSDSVVSFVFLLGFGNVPTVWYPLFFCWDLEMFRQCGSLCFPVGLWKCSDSVVSFVFSAGFWIEKKYHLSQCF